MEGVCQRDASGGEGKRHAADHRLQERQRGSLGRNPAGHVLAECFFKAPDETRRLEHVGCPSCSSILPRRFWSARGLRRRSWRRFLWRRELGHREGLSVAEPSRAPSSGTSARHVPQNERLAACGERREAHPPASNCGTPPLYEASGSNSRIRVARIASNCAASSGWTWHKQPLQHFHFKAERINGGPLVALERLDGLPC